MSEIKIKESDQIHGRCYDKLIFEMCTNRQKFRELEEEARKLFFKGNANFVGFPDKAAIWYWDGLIHAIANHQLGGGRLVARFNGRELPERAGDRILRSEIVAEKNGDTNGSREFLDGVMRHFGELIKEGGPYELSPARAEIAIIGEKAEILDEGELITPGYLLEKGFVSWEESEYLYDFDYTFNPGDGDLLFVQKELNRQMFAVILSPEIFEGQTESDGRHYGFQVFVRHNIGCGFVRIPNQFRHMPIKNFEMLYESIRREKL